ncbi:MAG: ABC transporter ATP-binding protein [Pseudobacteriovorax sp.]|nr:ABC transporter ATP-binding protein [Pseudobacteriovorax sp.]
MQAVLKIEKLEKRFGKLRAVRGTDFDVHAGQCFGLLGPNGAGKSTTIEMIEGIITPDAGHILYKGKPFDGSGREEMGVQFQSTSLLPKLTVRETLESFSLMYRKRVPIEELIDLCQLREFQHQRHEKVSGGQKQRLLLAIALCHDPELILLDEPTTGLDPQARRHVWDIVNSVKKRGKTIILTTHYMDEAQQLCDEIAIMDHGQIIARGSPRDLLQEHCKQTVVYLPGKEAVDFVKGHPDVFGAAFETGEGIEIMTTDLSRCLEALSQSQLDISQMNIRQSNLEDLFLTLTGKGLRG